MRGAGMRGAPFLARTSGSRKLDYLGSLIPPTQRRIPQTQSVEANSETADRPDFALLFRHFMRSGSGVSAISVTHWKHEGLAVEETR